MKMSHIEEQSLDLLLIVSYVWHLDIKKWQIYQKIDALKHHHLLTVKWICLDLFVIRERRSDLKRYCALFTCFASRAAHIEVANAMDTYYFIQALRRFIARRGAVRSIRSDNGINFARASNELKKTLEEMGQDWVKLQKNPPGASHTGGIWERKYVQLGQFLKHC